MQEKEKDKDSENELNIQELGLDSYDLISTNLFGPNAYMTKKDKENPLNYKFTQDIVHKGVNQSREVEFTCGKGRPQQQQLLLFSQLLKAWELTTENKPVDEWDTRIPFDSISNLLEIKGVKNNGDNIKTLEEDLSILSHITFELSKVEHEDGSYERVTNKLSFGLLKYQTETTEIFKQGDDPDIDEPIRIERKGYIKIDDFFIDQKKKKLLIPVDRDILGSEKKNGVLQQLHRLLNGESHRQQKLNRDCEAYNAKIEDFYFNMGWLPKKENKSKDTSKMFTAQRKSEYKQKVKEAINILKTYSVIKESDNYFYHDRINGKKVEFINIPYGDYYFSSEQEKQEVEEELLNASSSDVEIRKKFGQYGIAQHAKRILGYLKTNRERNFNWKETEWLVGEFTTERLIGIFKFVDLRFKLEDSYPEEFKKMGYSVTYNRPGLVISALMNNAYPNWQQESEKYEVLIKQYEEEKKKDRDKKKKLDAERVRQVNLILSLKEEFYDTITDVEFLFRKSNLEKSFVEMAKSNNLETRKVFQIIKRFFIYRGVNTFYVFMTDSDRSFLNDDLVRKCVTSVFELGNIHFANLENKDELKTSCLQWQKINSLFSIEEAKASHEIKKGLKTLPSSFKLRNVIYFKQNKNAFSVICTSESVRDTLLEDKTNFEKEVKKKELGDEISYHIYSELL